MSVDTPRLLEEVEVETALVMDEEGTILHNSFQQNDPVIAKKYDDGMTHLFSKRTGKLIVAPYNPEARERLRCPHCQGELGGSPSKER